jgi:hypothetical protein
MTTIAEIKKKAKTMNIQPGNMSKTEIIRALQTAEGNFSCFKTAKDGKCDQFACCWREDCFARR